MGVLMNPLSYSASSRTYGLRKNLSAPVQGANNRPDIQQSEKALEGITGLVSHNDRNLLLRVGRSELRCPARFPARAPFKELGAPAGLARHGLPHCPGEGQYPITCSYVNCGPVRR